jgi:hypothetical protein
MTRKKICCWVAATLNHRATWACIQIRVHIPELLHILCARASPGLIYRHSLPLPAPAPLVSIRYGRYPVLP